MNRLKILGFRLILTGSLLAVFQSSTAQIVSDSIRWIPLDSIPPRFAKLQKPVMLYLYAEDCDSCYAQERTTFSNPEVANYINVLFYPAKINVRTTEDLSFFDGNTYKNPDGKVHNLARMLTNGNDSLPALVLFSRRAKGMSLFGYQTRDDIFRPLIFYAEDIDQWTEYSEWKSLHTKAFPPGKQQVLTRLTIRWKSLKEAQELNVAEPRKTLLSFYNYNRISESVMRTQVFNERNVAEYLNKTYYPVNIDVFTQDTLTIKNISYINENQAYKYHQLPIAALEGKMIFPAFVILDENGNVLDKIQKFVTPTELLLIVKFYGDNLYKTTTWQDYLKNQSPK